MCQQIYYQQSVSTRCLFDTLAQTDYDEISTRSDMRFQLAVQCVDLLNKTDNKGAIIMIII